VSLDSIPVGFFHNLSQAAAAEKLLRMNEGHPLTTNEIMEAFRKSGMEITGKNSITILYTALKRSPKFERVAGKAWGMTEWYPEKRKKKDIAIDGSSEDDES
jgi:DNA-directed RNA polymerase delta subunit